MAETLDELKGRLRTLPEADRADLAHFLIHSLDDGEGDVEAAWEAEAARRLEELKSGLVVGKPAEQVFAELRAKYS
jgi:putative addiction module component (TIGR02574 family)